MPRILIVDDDTAGCRTLQLHLQAQGHATATAHTLDDGLNSALAEDKDTKDAKRTCQRESIPGATCRTP